MERKSEVVEGLADLREAILGYDAKADRSGAAWEELRMAIDRAVLKLIGQAQELEGAGDRVCRNVIALIEKEFERYIPPDVQG